MSDDSTTSVNEILGDQQRIELLEKSAKLNRLLIFGLAGGLVLLLLVVVLIAVFSGGSDEPEKPEAVASEASVVALEKRLVAVEQQVAAFQQQLKNQQSLIALAQSSPPAPATTTPPAAAAPSRPDRATIQQVASVLIGQEQNYQQSITALKNGMRDLAGMIAGSRSWLEDYEADLNKPLSESQTRVKALQQWSSGKPTAAQ
ncbi:hypothetical protein [Aquipseudomonas ullengensis]|uniref:Uncharacterized protein n=1 Tax=Aquipseudomonas ullengensis TaxID=2759166 RepID=A0A7W4LPV2_9GAMM|nr:hypothetical protein [Pseudomonas ullengensis]MBB2497166.1 hypothetical protein [Pseudomonas ullengensis]